VTARELTSTRAREWGLFLATSGDFNMATDNSIDAGPVLRPGLVREQPAWNFEELDRSDLSDFIDRWLGWFGKAAQGVLQRPHMMPEQTIQTDYWWRK
jgi:hypothetical protein